MAEPNKTPTLHWLTAAVANTGLLSNLPTEDVLTAIPPDATTEAAWEQASAVFGLSQDQIAQVVAAAYRLEAANTRFLQPEARALVPEDVARSLGVVPIRHTDATIVVATANPLDSGVESQLDRITGRRTMLSLAGPTAIKAAQDLMYGDDAPDTFVLSQLRLSAAMERVDLPEAARTQEARATPVEGLIRLVLYEAAMAEATSIRFEPKAKGGRVGFQVDDGMRTFVHLPVAAILRIMARIRHWAREGYIRPDQPMEIEIDGSPFELGLRVEGSASVDPLSLTLTRPGQDQAPEVSEGERDPAYRALVVDDEAGDRLLLRAMLKRSGFEVVEAVDGLEALEHLQGDEDFDVVLLDLMMPRLSGLEVLDRMRKTVKTAGMPVIVITASEDEEDRRRLLSAGADDYLQKPINPPRVAERVKALLRRSLATV